MKAIAAANRLIRDLKEKDLAALSSDARLAVQDSLNFAIQKLNPVAPDHSKVTTGSLFLEPVVTISIGVVNGSPEITGTAFTAEQYGRTIRIDGDTIDNQIVGTASLLHPYGGITGTVTAMVYSDAVALPEEYSEIVGEPVILETGRRLISRKFNCVSWQRKGVCEPRFYWVESNARNNNPTAPAIVRFNPLPDRSYRLQVEVQLAPARVSFIDLLKPGYDLPVRAELVEVYLLPIARGQLANSPLWLNPTTKQTAKMEAEQALADYARLTPTNIATPSNWVGTTPGF